MINKNPKIISSTNSSNYDNKNNRRGYNLLIFIKVLLLVAVIILLGYFVYYSSFFQVDSIEVEGGELVERSKLEQLAYDYLAREKNNIWLFDSYSLKQLVRDRFPVINKVVIQKGIPDTVKIIVYERKPKLVWVSDNQKYLVDDQGFAFINLNDYQEKKNQLQKKLIKIIDRSNLTVENNQRLVSKDWVDFVFQLDKRLLNDFNLPPKKYYITETAFDLYIVTEIGEIIFDTNQSIGEQLSALKTTRETVKKNIFDYLDLRINGWVYYQ